MENGKLKFIETLKFVFFKKISRKSNKFCRKIKYLLICYLCNVAITMGIDREIVLYCLCVNINGTLLCLFEYVAAKLFILLQLESIN